MRDEFKASPGDTAAERGTRAAAVAAAREAYSDARGASRDADSAYETAQAEASRTSNEYLETR